MAWYAKFAPEFCKMAEGIGVQFGIRLSGTQGTLPVEENLKLQYGKIQSFNVRCCAFAHAQSLYTPALAAIFADKFAIHLQFIRRVCVICNVM